MSLEKAKAYLSARGYADHIIELAASTATVSEAAQALGVQPGMIAKTMSFLQDDQPVLILTEGGPGTATYLSSYIIYNEAFVKYNFGYASAMSFVLFVITAVFTWLSFRVSGDSE